MLLNRLLKCLRMSAGRGSVCLLAVILPLLAVTQCLPREGYAVFEGVNAIRIEHGVPPLRLDADLTARASVRAYELAERRSLSHHAGAEKYGKDMPMSEILALFKSENAVETTIREWQRSEPHLAVILDPLYTKIGIGAVSFDDGAYTIFAVFLEGD